MVQMWNIKEFMKIDIRNKQLAINGGKPVRKKIGLTTSLQIKKN